MVAGQQSFFESVSIFRSAIMGLSMVSIMLFHQYFTSVIPFNIFHNFGHWGVDVFLFLSGMGLVNSLERNSIKNYYRRRFMRLVPSCIFCGSLKYLVSLLLGVIVVNYSKDMSLGLSAIASLDLWFIPTIIILYLISPFLYYCLRKWIVLAILGIVVLFFYNALILNPCMGYDWKSPFGVLSWTLERLPVFSYGMFIAIYKNLDKKKILISLLFLLIAICIKLLDKVGISFFASGECMYFSLAIGMPSLIHVLISILELASKSLLTFISFFGIYSLEFYLVHEFIFWTLMLSWRDGSPWILLTLGFLLSSLFAYLCKLCTNYITLLIDRVSQRTKQSIR